MSMSGAVAPSRLMRWAVRLSGAGDAAVWVIIILLGGGLAWSELSLAQLIRSEVWTAWAVVVVIIAAMCKGAAPGSRQGVPRRDGRVRGSPHRARGM
jgi:hypothetical protein